MIDHQICVACRAVDDGYKYTVVQMKLGFNAIIIDDGSYDDPNATIGQALSDILKNLPCCTGRESEFVPIKYSNMIKLINKLKEKNPESSRKHTNDYHDVDGNPDMSHSTTPTRIGSQDTGSEVVDMSADNISKFMKSTVIINYDISGKILGYITWVADEEFGELLETTFHIGKMKATDIVELEGLSMEAKILLSAIAGALIQHLFETDVNLTEAFETGTFWIGSHK